MTDEALQILLADDDPDDRMLFSDALKSTAFAVHLITVPNGAALMKHLTSGLVPLPNVLFLDLNMPLKNGLECFMEIKSNAVLKEMPVVIFSTAGSAQLVDKLYEAGANYFIRKPHDFGNLIKLVNHVIENIYKKKIEQPARKEFLLE